MNRKASCAATIFAALQYSSAIAADDSVLAFRSIDRKDSANYEVDGSFYYDLSVSYVNIQDAPDSSIWKSIKNIFSTADKNIILTGKADIGDSIVGTQSGRVLAFMTPNGSSLANGVTFNAPVLPPKRINPALNVTVSFKFSATDVPKESQLYQALGSVEKVPIVNNFTKGTLTLGAGVIDSISKAASDPTKDTQRGIDIVLGATDIIGANYIALVSRNDLESFDKLGSSLPLDGSKLKKDQSVPTYILLKVRLRDSIFATDSILSTPSIRDSVGDFLQRISSAGTPRAKAEECAKLTSFANSTLDFTPKDRDKLAIAAMKQAMYNPYINYEYMAVDCFSPDTLASEVASGHVVFDGYTISAQTTIMVASAWSRKKDIPSIIGQSFAWSSTLPSVASGSGSFNDLISSVSLTGFRDVSRNEDFPADQNAMQMTGTISTQTGKTQVRIGFLFERDPANKRKMILNKVTIDPHTS